jgi:hypothetical protein
MFCVIFAKNSQNQQHTIIYHILMNALLQFARSQYEIAKLQLESAEKLLREAESQAQKIDSADQWVYIGPLSARLGISVNAVYARVGRWTEGVHYKRERPDKKKSRLLFNTHAIQTWLQNIPASNFIEENLEYGSPGMASAASSRSTSTQRRHTSPQPPACVVKYLKK